eukprot:3089932-Pyramimonas_sp.AAC.1
MAHDFAMFIPASYPVLGAPSMSTSIGRTRGSFGYTSNLDAQPGEPRQVPEGVEFDGALSSCCPASRSPS